MLNLAVRTETARILNVKTGSVTLELTVTFALDLHNSGYSNVKAVNFVILCMLLILITSTDIYLNSKTDFSFSIVKTT
jgi:hypothetical protein